MARRTKLKRSVAILTARREDGSVVECHELELDAYYDGSHAIIDSGKYRAARGIVSLDGLLVGTAGDVLQEFRNRYAADGRYVGGRTVHADGTVCED
jgi:hypothetical protein